MKGSQMSIELIVSGAAGRMGKRVIALAVEAGQFKIVTAIERSTHPDIGTDAGTLAGTKSINVPISNSCPSTADVMIDFSMPEAADANIDYCVKSKVALVLGTTGLSEPQFQKLKNAAQYIPIVQATNMSVGMNVLFNLVGKAAAMLGTEYDVEIIEQHHRFKKDAPSGSALTLSKNVAAAEGWPWPACLVHGRNGSQALRTANTIGIHAIRAGDITGEHKVIFSTLGETVTLSHSAHNRDNFARGALRAAGWLVGKKPALYSMADVLGIR
jgi:4-hydroxy-tetrahydrodipicolinate reductase